MAGFPSKCREDLLTFTRKGFKIRMDFPFILRLRDCKTKVIILSQKVRTEGSMDVAQLVECLPSAMKPWVWFPHCTSQVWWYTLEASLGCRRPCLRKLAGSYRGNVVFIITSVCVCSFHTDYSPVLCARTQKRSEYKELAQGHGHHVALVLFCVAVDHTLLFQGFHTLSSACLIYLFLWAC